MNDARTLLSKLPSDYVAEWNPEEQKQYGAAKGKLPGEPPSVTGDFPVERWHPYFVSAAHTKDVHYVGKMPPRVVFELIHNPLPETSYNYIILPLDTTIKKASDLCREIPMGDNDWIAYWDPLKQEEIWSTRTCEFIHLNDFDLYPGQVYKITIDQDKSWTQT